MDDSKSEKVALFRYGLIATLVLERLSRGELMRRARELAALEYDIPFSARTRICVGTLLKWARRDTSRVAPVAVGTAISRGPPHRPVLALLTHTVPT